MFYLGSIAGILPYLLAFSFTIVLGSHASLPLFKSEATTASKNEIPKEKHLSARNLKSFIVDNQVIAEKVIPFLMPFVTTTKVLGFYLFRLSDSSEPGISRLRAPPFFLF
jgi:hypothetical protein